MSQLYNPISLDTLLPSTVPGVGLFIKHNSQFVLYKAPGQEFSEKDRGRLVDHNVETLYVYAGELSSYNQYVEANLSTILHDDKLPPSKRREILCSATVNYVNELFHTQSTYISQNLDRCRHLISYIIREKFDSTTLLETLGGLVRHNSYTYVHSVQVSSYSMALHSCMFRLDEEALIDIGVGSVFHDYGKVYIKTEILDKPGQLTPLEFYEVKKHSQYGYEQLKLLGSFSARSLSIVRHHHEKINGKGYPDGLRGEEIGKSARIAAIADVYSALTSNRAYREALGKDAALNIMFNEMDGSFDVHYLSAFAGMLSS